MRISDWSSDVCSSDLLALEIGERRLERIAVMDAHTVAEMRAHRVGDLFGGDKQVGGRVGVEQGEGEPDRGVADVLPTDIESPGDRIERDRKSTRLNSSH